MPVFTKYATPGGSTPQLLCTGPDGRIWATDSSTGYVFAITTGGTLTSYATGTATIGICSDGTDLWVTDLNYPSNLLWKVTTGGSGTSYTLLGGAPWSLVYGADTYTWIASSSNINTPQTSYWHATALGVSTGYSNAVAFTHYAAGNGVAYGPDSNYWFTDAYNAGVWKVTAAGTPGTFYGLSGAIPSYIIVGPDSNLWVTDQNGFIWMVTTAGVGTKYALPGSFPQGLCSDGTYMWVADSSGGTNGAYWKVTTAGGSQKFALPGAPGSTSPIGTLIGPDGNLWITDNFGAIWKVNRAITQGWTVGAVNFN